MTSTNSTIDTLKLLIEGINIKIKALQAAGTPMTDDTMLRLLAERIKRLNQLSRAEAQFVKEEAERKKQAFADSLDREALSEQAKNEWRAWLADNDYYYTHNDATFWLFSPDASGAQDQWTHHSRSNLVNHNPRLDVRGSEIDFFVELLQEDGRWFRDSARTFAPVGPHTLNMLRWQFIEPIQGQPHSWVFDTLLQSLGGGKLENIEHLEKVILAKWCNPANYTLPTIIISDDGGTGKGLLAEKVLPVIFGEDLVVPNLAMDEMTGQFNSQTIGKAVLAISENRADRNDYEGIKRILGSKTVRSERKGKDAKRNDNTALVMVFGNFTLGAIKLSGTEVDRRFSVMQNNHPLKHYTARVLKISENDAYTWMWEVGQHIISDPTEVAKWLGHLLDKYGRLENIIALHGDDYDEMVEGQAGTDQQVFRAFFASDAWTVDGYLNQATMYKYFTDYVAGHKQFGMSNTRLYSECERWLKRKNISYTRHRSVNFGAHTTADIFSNNPIKLGAYKPNDHHFFHLDTNNYNRLAWDIDID